MPSPPTPLIGRAREVASVVEQLLRPGVRLVTLTGPGGVGKTRLSLAAAQAVEHEFPDGIVFVSLAAMRDPHFVVPAIAQAVGVQEGSSDTLQERVVASLGGRHLLLVLDNFEHLLEAVPAVGAVLSGVPTLSVLATSRRRLRLSGEQEVPVGPMVVPEAGATPEELAASEAVRLFLARAAAVRPDTDLASAPESLDTIAEICRRLDGLPLAIELAAARVNMLPLPSLLARLEQRLPLLVGGARDLPLRQQTMRDTIAWSYDLLTKGEQRLFQWMSHFAGGMALDAAEALAATLGAEQPAPVEQVASLVESNLLRLDPESSEAPRYLMLETIREYGREQLQQSGEAKAAGDWHAAWFLAEAARGVPDFFEFPSSAWLTRLAADHDNLGAAGDWMCREEAADACLRLADVCFEYWFQRGHIREGGMWTNRALAIADSGVSAARARVTCNASIFALFSGDLETASAMARESLIIWRALDDAHGIAVALLHLGLVEESRLHWEEAARFYEEAVAIWRPLEKNHSLAIVLALLGGVAHGQGDSERALALIDEARTRARDEGDHGWEALTEWYLGLFAASEGRFLEAGRYYRACVQLEIEGEDRRWIYRALAGLAAVAVEYGLVEPATNLLGAVDELLQRTGTELFPFDRPGYEQADSRVRASLSAEQHEALRRAGRRLTPEDWQVLAESVVAAAEEAERSTSRRGERHASGLSAREQEVLRLVAEQLTDQEIADRLFISRRTVSTHVASILNRFGVHSRQEAVRHARAAGGLPDAGQQAQPRTR